jgi:hypothetical protein
VKLLFTSNLLLTSNAVVDYKTVCPELVCDPEKVGGDLVDGACFKMKTEVPTDPILAGECYDASNAGKSEKAKLCPFNLESGQYAWINEKIQDGIQTDLEAPFDGSDD